MTTPTPADITPQAPKRSKPNSPSVAARFAVEQVVASLAESIEQDAESIDLDTVATLAELTRHLAALTHAQAAMMNAIRAKQQAASA